MARSVSIFMFFAVFSVGNMCFANPLVTSPNLSEVAAEYSELVEKAELSSETSTALRNVSYYTNCYNNNLDRYFGFRTVAMFCEYQIKANMLKYEQCYESLCKGELDSSLSKKLSDYHHVLMSHVKKWKTLVNMYSQYKGHLL